MSVKDKIAEIISYLRSNSELTSLVSSNSIVRAYPPRDVDLPAIFIHKIDSYSNPSFGYLSGKERRLSLELQFDISSAKSFYEADNIASILEKILLTYPCAGVVKTAEDEAYDSRIGLYVNIVRYRFLFNVKD